MGHGHSHKDKKSEIKNGNDHVHGGLFGARSELIFAILSGVFLSSGWLLERS